MLVSGTKNLESRYLHQHCLAGVDICPEKQIEVINSHQQIIIISRACIKELHHLLCQVDLMHLRI